ncbi:MAG: type II secretion system protein GspL [Gammaproteobacteria bacterium]|jgi:general secretion pathway protein L
MDLLILRLLDDDLAEWRDGDRIVHGPLAQAATVARERRLAVLVPGRDVLLSHADIPSRNRAQVERALPYALEEWLIEPPETQHFAWRQATSGVDAAVVSRARLEDWLARLTGAGLQPELLVPETLALPWQAGEWSLLLSGDQAWLRTGPHAGQACDRDVLPVLITSLWEQFTEDDRPQRLRLWCLDGDAPADLPLPVERVPAPDSVLRVFTVEGEVLNLLSGAYAPRARLSRRLGPWRSAAVAAGIWLLSAFAVHGVDYFRLAHEAAALQRQIDAVYRQAVPGSHRIVNARVQMQQALDALSDGAAQGGPLGLLAPSAGVFANTAGVHITKLTYRNGRLSLDLTAPDIGTFDTLKTKLQRQHLQVDMGSVGSQGGVTSGHLTLKRGGA